MRTQYYTATSLDGFIATEDDSLEWLFPLGDIGAVQIGSVTLGSGKDLFPRAVTSPPLRLISARALGSGFAELHYEIPKPGR